MENFKDTAKDEISYIAIIVAERISAPRRGGPP